MLGGIKEYGKSTRKKQKNKFKQKLLDFFDQLILSKKLVQIISKMATDFK